MKENKWLGSGGGSSAKLVRSSRDRVVSGPKTLMTALQEWDPGASGQDNDFLVSRLPDETLGRCYAGNPSGALIYTPETKEKLLPCI